MGPGTELKRLLRKFGITEQDCHCTSRAQIMDLEGPDWCQANIEYILDWLQEAAADRHLPFIRWAAKVLLKLAIHRSRKKLKFLGVKL